MENLKLYEKVRVVPVNAQREIQAGRLKGKTDINPMWRIKALTEEFGPCGIGWKYEITKQWTEQGGNDEIAAFVNINLYIKNGDKWSDAVPGTGGSSFVAKEKNGLFTSDECYKMALTDALSVSCKALGFGADIYWQKDANKYDRLPQTQYKANTEVKQQGNAITPKKEVKPSTMPQNGVYKCSNCDDDIKENVYNFSKQKFGKPLCFKCQKGVSK